MSATTGSAQPGQLPHLDRLGEAHDPVVRLVDLEDQADAARRRPRPGSRPGGCGWWSPPPPGGRPTGPSPPGSGTRRRSPPARPGTPPRPRPGPGRPAPAATRPPRCSPRGPPPPRTPGPAAWPRGPSATPASPRPGRSPGWSSATARDAATGRRPPQVGVQQHPGGVDHRPQQGGRHRLRPGPGRRRVAGGDGGPGRVDQQRVGQVDVGQAPGQGVDRRRPRSGLHDLTLGPAGRQDPMPMPPTPAFTMPSGMQILKAVSIFLTVAVVAPLVTAGTALSAILYLPFPAPELPDPKPSVESRVTHIFDATGAEIGVFRRFDTSIPVEQKDIPEILKQAVVAAEDKRFYSHGGFDIFERHAGAVGRLPGQDGGPGRVHHHPAVREEGLHGRGAHPVPQDPGGGARRPARPQGHQGRDPLPLPQHHLPRRRRLRRRGGGGVVLPQAGERAHPVGVGPPRRPHLGPVRLRPPGQPRAGRVQPPATSSTRCSSRSASPRPSTPRPGPRSCSSSGPTARRSTARRPRPAPPPWSSRSSCSRRPSPTSSTTCAGTWWPSTATTSSTGAA